MQKRTRIRPTDPNQLAHQIVHESIVEVPDPTQEQISAVMRAMGKKGGKIGGKARWKGVTAKDRTRAARKAANAMWKKRKT